MDIEWAYLFTHILGLSITVYCVFGSGSKEFNEGTCPGESHVTCRWC